VVANSKQNSELIVGLVRTEVDRAVGRLGFVREEELAAVRRHVERLERALAEAQTPAGAKGLATGRKAKPATRPAAKPAAVPAPDVPPETEPVVEAAAAPDQQESP
jgi:hypothetical protein